MPDSPANPTTTTMSDGLQNVPLVVPGITNEQEDEQDKFFNFTESRIHLKYIIEDWHTEVEDTEVRRKERKVEIDVEGLRQKGDLDEDETIIPIRVIDSNITREQPPYINYLKNSRRIAIFKSQTNPQQDCDLLEQAFTECSSYTAWETPHFKTLDGSMAHGWDSVEVVLDTSKPGNFAIEHIGHDKLLFPRSAVDIQKCPRILRCYDVTLIQLQDWIDKYGFDKDQVQKIRDARKHTQKEAETYRIYKLFFKKTNIVFVAWFCMTDGVDDWLKKPIQYYCGIDDPQTLAPKPLQTYPIFILPYKLSEEDKVTDCKGRGFLDSYKQEAQTALWSAFINGMNRASGIYASPGQEDGTGVSLRQIEDLKLTPGRVYNKPVQFWSTPYPDPIVLRTLQYSDVSNSEETNQVNFAAMNREDSRKTAKEIGAAQQQQQLLNSVQLTLFSTYVRSVYSFVWLIVQSQALQNKIRFLLISQQQPVMNPINPRIPMTDPQTGQPQMQTIWINDVQTINQTYTLRAAGDVDVILKEELIQKMQQDFKLVMQTPLRDQFIVDYFRLKYPEKADQYVQILGQDGQMQQMKSLIGRLGTYLEGALKDAPQVLQQLPQNERADMTQTMQEAQQFMGGPTSQ